MKNEMMSSGKGKRKITLDPRTKLALLLMVATFVLGGAGGNELIWARILLAIIPAILLLFSGKVKAFFVFEMLFLAGCLLQYYLLGKLSGFFNFLVLATAGILSQFIPGLMMGYYTVTTTTVSEFVAAMERMHMPKQIVIPLSVMFLSDGRRRGIKHIRCHENERNILWWKSSGKDAGISIDTPYDLFCQNRR